MNIPRTCQVCGCTDAMACPGGCWWVGPELCSACDGQVPALPIHTEEEL